MKIIAQQLLEYFKNKPKVSELSERLFQLGHEHELNKGILDFEITPNRGDCLSLKGLARDLNYFYKAEIEKPIFTKKIQKLNLNFKNKTKDLCPNISFLEVEIVGKTKPYKNYLENYFKSLKINKNNFFTDISNYLAYESGQPTHCFDAEKMNGIFALEKNKKKSKFLTLLNEEIEIEKNDLVFTLDGKVISLAGVMGGASTACGKNTYKVLIECAYFKPEEILGQARKYNLNSEAAYKFERGVDFLGQENVLRRFIKIIDDHAEIKSLKFISENKKNNTKSVPYDSKKLNEIVGCDINEKEQKAILSSLGFINGKKVAVPAHRSDIDQINDLAEEITRVVGYNNIPSKALKLPVKAKNLNRSFELICRNYLVNNGFFEVINFPFNDNNDESAIVVDNPLDKQRAKMRVCLTKSLKDNLVYNQNRQKDSIKFFEFSDIYTKLGVSRKLSLIVSGRINKNHKEFNSLLDYGYLKGLLKTIFNETMNVALTFSSSSSENYDFRETIMFKGTNIGRIGKLSKNFLKSKVKTPVYSFEIDIDSLSVPSQRYIGISDYPASYRDMSYSLENLDILKNLEKKIEKNVKSFKLLQEAFVFDYFDNKKLNILKVGYRFKFQSSTKSPTDREIDEIMKKINKDTLSIKGIKIEGL